MKIRRNGEDEWKCPAFRYYISAADFNFSAMSAISTAGINPKNPEAPVLMKLIWGSLVGLIAWVMITSAGIGGIRMLGILGGFPALFILFFVGIGLAKTAWQLATQQACPHPVMNSAPESPLESLGNNFSGNHLRQEKTIAFFQKMSYLCPPIA